MEEQEVPATVLMAEIHGLLTQPLFLPREEQAGVHLYQEQVELVAAEVLPEAVSEQMCTAEGMEALEEIQIPDGAARVDHRQEQELTALRVRLYGVH
jgi:hypothetical protein